MPQRLEAEVLDVGAAAGGEQDRVGRDRDPLDRSAWAVHDASGPSVVTSTTSASEVHVDALRGQHLGELVAEARLLVGQESGPLLEQGHGDAESVEGLGQLDAGGTAADDRRATTAAQSIGEEVVGGQEAGVGQTRDGGHEGAAARGQQDGGGVQRPRAVDGHLLGPVTRPVPVTMSTPKAAAGLVDRRTTPGSTLIRCQTAARSMAGDVRPAGRSGRPSASCAPRAAAATSAFEGTSPVHAAVPRHGRARPWRREAERGGHPPGGQAPGAHAHDDEVVAVG